MSQGTAVVVVQQQFVVISCVYCGEWLGELLGSSSGGRFRCKKCHRNVCVRTDDGNVHIVHRSTQECISCRSAARCDRIRV